MDLAAGSDAPNVGLIGVAPHPLQDIGHPVDPRHSETRERINQQSTAGDAVHESFQGCHERQQVGCVLSGGVTE
jgi:hypothetical protein